MAKRYLGRPYIIGLDRRHGTAGLLDELRRVARATQKADKKADVVTRGRHPKSSPNALRKALDELA